MSNLRKIENLENEIERKVNEQMKNCRNKSKNSKKSN